MTNGIFDVYTDYISGSWVNRCETIYFSQISDWINEGDGEYMFSNTEPDWRDDTEAYVTGVFNEEGDQVL